MGLARADVVYVVVNGVIKTKIVEQGTLIGTCVLDHITTKN